MLYLFGYFLFLSVSLFGSLFNDLSCSIQGLTEYPALRDVLIYNFLANLGAQSTLLGPLGQLSRKMNNEQI